MHRRLLTTQPNRIPLLESAALILPELVRANAAFVTAARSNLDSTSSTTSTPKKYKTLHLAYRIIDGKSQLLYDHAQGTMDAFEFLDNAIRDEEKVLRFHDDRINTEVRLSIVITTNASPKEPSTDRYTWESPRTLALRRDLAPPHEVALMGRAAALLEYHQSTRFCSSCGGAMMFVAADSSSRTSQNHKQCVKCGAHRYPRTNPCAIVLVHDPRADALLLARGKNWPPSQYSCVAGFCEFGEGVEETARREVWEETGVVLEPNSVRISASQPWPLRREGLDVNFGDGSSLMVGCFASAREVEININKEEIEDARWFSRSEIEGVVKSELPASSTMAHNMMKAFLEASTKCKV